MAMASDYLLVIGDREALGWILAEQRTAFPDARRPEVRRLDVGDRLYIYTTRGCFKNPGRDRGRIIGRATVASITHLLPEPMVFSGREFPIGCDLQIKSLAPFGEGLDLADLTAELDALSGAPGGHWAFRLRRPLVQLSSADASLLNERLGPTVKSRADVLERYVRWYREAPGKSSR